MATSSSSASLFLVIFSTVGHPAHKREKMKFPAKKNPRKSEPKDWIKPRSAVIIGSSDP